MRPVEGKSTTFAPGRSAREALATAASASLGTLGVDGAPFVSLVTVATMPEGPPILLISRLAVHSQNLERDPRASLLLVAAGGESGDPLAGARLTLVGRISAVADVETAKRRFLARNPSAAGYAEFGDFAFKGLEAQSAHLVAGFGRIVSVPLTDIFPDYGPCREARDAEAEIVAHLNSDHRDTLGLYATRLLGQEPGDWQATGADPDGVDLASGRGRARLWYPERAKNPALVRRFLKELAEEARRR